jgi:hypothetical protein
MRRWGDAELDNADGSRPQFCIQALGGIGTPVSTPDEDLLKRFAPSA